jgi:hypothetical protein
VNNAIPASASGRTGYPARVEQDRIDGDEGKERGPPYHATADPQRPDGKHQDGIEAEDDRRRARARADEERVEQDEQAERDQKRAAAVAADIGDAVQEPASDRGHAESDYAGAARRTPSPPAEGYRTWRSLLNSIPPPSYGGRIMRAAPVA